MVKIGLYGASGKMAQSIISCLKDENGKFICEMADGGQVKTNLKMQTSLKGLFVAGDIREDAPKQVIVAAGDGAVAALSAMSYIESLH